MLFTSYEFLLFAGMLLVLYYTLPKKTQWMLLTLASYIFYGLSGPGYLIFILITTTSAYLTALFIDRNTETEVRFLEANRDKLTKDQRKKYREGQKKRRFFVLIAGLVVGFGLLAVMKYTAFAVTNINFVLHKFGAEGLNIPNILLPLGISFYTFQTMGYLIDVYRGTVRAERNPAKLALFVSFFPQLIQGPISRFGDLHGQLISGHDFDSKNLVRGLWRMLWGYFKKLVIADRILVAVNELIDKPAEYRGVYVVLLILFYSIQIYADFTGGIDITIGLAEALGIRLAENFNRPFSSKSTKEYWRRWHITMGTWFTDYVFYPLSVSRPMQRLSKFCRRKLGNSLGKRIPVYLASIITWFLTGLWHGAGWNFIVWGLLNCLVILVSQELQPLYDGFHKAAPRLTASRGYSAFMAARTFWLMGAIRILDCYRNVPLTFRMFGSIFTTPNWGELAGVATGALGLGIHDYVVVLSGCLLVWAVSRLNGKKDIRERLRGRPVASFAAFSLLFLSVVVFGAYGFGYDAKQFIFNQF
ncbi:MAG TPA: MBOAT family O-acyltransferase [Bacillota bacterium]|nr:MBOAT family O-acyltransferase [Bacillota bacterium]